MRKVRVAVEAAVTALSTSVDAGDRAVEADELMVARADPGTPEHGSLTRDEDDIGLRAAAVEGRRGRRDGGGLGHGQMYVRCVGTKVVVVGGGSTYTPELVDGLCDLEDRMVVDDLVLLDPSELRREVVGGLSASASCGRGDGQDVRHDGRTTPPSRAPASSWSDSASVDGRAA